ncbi:hypothetical protein GCM10027589_47440 [Actinocorallia lasiicapitis]
MTKDEEREKLQAGHPRWRVWRGRYADGSPGELYATRRRDLTDDEFAAGLAQTLPMGVTKTLAEQLAWQDRLDDELA